MKKKVLIILSLVILVIIIFQVFNIYSNILKRFYPNTYSEYVEKYSEKYEIEKEWIFALIKAESNFKKESVSKSGAVGLMQLMDSTAKEVSKEIRNKRCGFKKCRYEY